MISAANSELVTLPNHRSDFRRTAQRAACLTRTSGLTLWLIVMAFLPLLTVLMPATSAALQTDPQQLEVNQISGLFSEPDAAMSRMRMELRIRVRNLTEQPLTPSRDDFGLLVNGQRGGMLSGSAMKEIPPGGTAELVLIFSDINPGSGNFPEPGLILQYDPHRGPDSGVVSIDLNQTLRDLTKISSESLGPDGCLALIRINRDLDIPAIWLLDERLKQTLETPARRLIVVAENVQQKLHVSVFGEWIRSEFLVDSPGSLPPDQRLVDVRVAGFTYPGTEIARRHASSAGSDIALHDQVDEAIRQSLRPVYRFVSADVLLGDLLRAPTTVKAAAATSVDRLSRDQQQTLFDALLNDSEETLAPIIPDLFRCSDPQVTNVLQQLASSSREQTAAAAVRCLAQSSSPEVQRIFEELWRHPAASQAAFLQDAIVSATIEIDDHRWASFVALWVETRLRNVAQGNGSVAQRQGSTDTSLSPNPDLPDDRPPAVDDRGDPAAEVPAPAAPPDEPDAANPPAPMNRGEVERLTLALAYLRAHGDVSALNIQRQWLLQIPIPQIQDVVVQNIWGWQQAEDEALVRAYIRTRLNSGQITDTTRNAVLIFPDREWSEALLKDFRQVSTPLHARRRSLQSALRCSDTQTLDQLVSSIDSLDTQSQGFLLEHLAAVGYPSWHEIAERLFRNNGPLFHQLMDILLADGSERSVLIMTRRLDELITPENGSREITPENRMHAERLISRVSLFVHPEARKVLNRCARSTDEIIRGRTQGAFAAAARRSPSEPIYAMALSSFYAGQFQEALQAVEQAIEADELRASLYLLRGEILLRMDRTDEAKQSLLYADFLNPESPAIWLQIALLKTQQSRIDEGLKLVDEALKLGESDPLHFVSAAAVFSEAAARCPPEEADRKAEFIDKSFTQLETARSNGFANMSRLQLDSIFAPLKDDPRWKAIASP